MTSNKSQDVNNEAQIRALIERWAKAVRGREPCRHCGWIMTPEFSMFDVPPPFSIAGPGTPNMATREMFFSSVEKPITFNPRRRNYLRAGGCFCDGHRQVRQHRSERQAGAAGISIDHGLAQDCRRVACHA